MIIHVMLVQDGGIYEHFTAIDMPWCFPIILFNHMQDNH
jgi:hypothetical protein